MARKDRVSMDRHAQILELHRRGYSTRRIAHTLKMCKKSVRKYIERPIVKPVLITQSVDKSEEPLRPEVDPNAIILQFPSWLQEMDWKNLVKERAKGVSVKVLYHEVGKAEVSFWSFGSILKRLSALLNPEIPKTTMRILHKPGEKTFVDYGDGTDIVILTPEKYERLRYLSEHCHSVVRSTQNLFSIKSCHHLFLHMKKCGRPLEE